MVTAMMGTPGARGHADVSRPTVRVLDPGRAPRTRAAACGLLDAEERPMVADLAARAVSNPRGTCKPAGLKIGAKLRRSAGASFCRLYALAPGTAMGW